MGGLLADENFNNAVLRGARLARATLDVVRVQDVGLSSVNDPVILDWAANERRILLTHDAATVPFHAYERIRVGQRMSGVCVVPRGVPVARVIDDILLIAECSTESDCTRRARWTSALRAPRLLAREVGGNEREPPIALSRQRRLTRPPDGVARLRQGACAPSLISPGMGARVQPETFL